MRVLTCAVFVVAGLSAPAGAQTSQPPPAVPVGVVTAERKPVTKALDFVGRVEARDRVEVRARVTGYLEGILFKEGDLIKEGAPLYSIEKGLFEAAVGQADGALERSKAAKILTEVQLQRAEDLLAKSSGTAVARDQALAADDSAKGAITIDEANLRTAKINLGYTDINSPIAGKVGKTSITKGNVVSPDSGALTVIVSQDPMYVTFPVSQREFLRAQQVEHKEDITGIKVQLRFADGSSYKHLGQINFVDVSVNRSTDTVFGPRLISRSRFCTGRRPTGARGTRERQAGGKDRDSAGRADFRSGGCVRLCCKRRKGRGPEGQAGGRKRDRHHHRPGPDRRGNS